MKIYNKQYEDYINLSPKGLNLASIGMVGGDITEYQKLYKKFFFDAYEGMFDTLVRMIWLEFHFEYNGRRRLRRRGNGFVFEWAFSFFLKAYVGNYPKPFSQNYIATGVLSYMKEFFPEFLTRDPFKEPEAYRYPYKFVTLDYLYFVWMCHNRLELLEHAEKTKMKYAEFVDFATNQMLCYNDEVGKDVYVLHHDDRWRAYIQRILPSRSDYFRWYDEKLNFLDSDEVTTYGQSKYVYPKSQYLKNGGHGQLKYSMKASFGETKKKTKKKKHATK